MSSIVDFDANEHKYNSINGLCEMEHLTRKRNRILEIRFLDSHVKHLNLNLLLDHCTSLKGLYIKSLGPCLKIEGDEDENNEENEDFIRRDDCRKNPNQEKTNSWASDLEDVVLSFNSNRRKETRPDINIKNLILKMQKQNANLKYMELFCCASLIQYGNN